MPSFPQRLDDLEQRLAAIEQRIKEGILTDLEKLKAEVFGDPAPVNSTATPDGPRTADG